MKFEDIKKLHQRKYREQFGYFLIEGEHLLLELQKAARFNPLLQDSELYVTPGRQHLSASFRTHVISEARMAQISDTKSPQGVVAVVPLLPPVPTRADERAIYLHEVQDPGNLGTILRSLAWFGRFRCLLSPSSVDPYNAKSVRASMGAILRVPVEIDVELASLPTRFARIAGLGMEGERLSAPEFRSFGCYLFGNEARGLPGESLSTLNVTLFSIQGAAAVESLNLGSAVTICAYELNR